MHTCYMYTCNMQDADQPEPRNQMYNADMPRQLSKHRPAQGARMLALRRAAGLSQIELAKLVGETQQNIAFWEQSDKPPRSEVLPRMSQALGVEISDILGSGPIAAKKPGPAGRLQRAFNDVSALPRRQQEKVIDFLDALLNQYKRQSTLESRREP